jgi:hypothetical protein
MSWFLYEEGDTWIEQHNSASPGSNVADLMPGLQTVFRDPDMAEIHRSMSGHCFDADSKNDMPFQRMKMII